MNETNELNEASVSDLIEYLATLNDIQKSSDVKVYSEMYSVIKRLNERLELEID
ncbi:hypothetical protein ACKXGF_07740 [Alkalibacillus sp. S2W]|uniref:hypothetical protein n=1 Tax=Alkalibacillus sp. S2W TaxID=3386553 RepID=UPI00398D25D3